MELKLTNKTTVKDVQEVFRKSFPFLNLVFFRKPSQGEEMFLIDQMIKDPETYITLEELQISDFSTELRFGADTKISKVEYAFRTLNLYVQVFRKSGKTWLQTTTSDESTLYKLNKLGEEMSVGIMEEREEDVDIY